MLHKHMDGTEHDHRTIVTDYTRPDRHAHAKRVGNTGPSDPPDSNGFAAADMRAASAGEYGEAAALAEEIGANES